MEERKAGMIIMLLNRLLLLKDLEVYEIKKTLYGDVEFYLILVDLCRPSESKDFEYIAPEDFTSRENFIKAVIVYDKEMTEGERELTYEIASGFLEEKEECDWNMEYVKADFEELRVIGVNKKELVNKVNDILVSAHVDKKIESVNTESFKYLLQY